MAMDLHIETADQPGALAAIGETLGRAGVNIEGVGATTRGGVGQLHLLVDDAFTAVAALEEAGHRVVGRTDPVIVDDVRDEPGFLGGIANRIAHAGVNIEAVYVATGTRIVLVCSDPDGAREALND